MTGSQVAFQGVCQHHSNDNALAAAFIAVISDVAAGDLMYNMYPDLLGCLW